MTRAAMTPFAAAHRACAARRLLFTAMGLVTGLALSLPLRSPAQATPSAVATGASSSPSSQMSAPSRSGGKPAVEQGIRWHDLKAAQQASLKPLEQDWSAIDAPRKQKWLQIVARFPKMSAPEQERVRARMADWAKLSPQERGQTRMNFQEARQLPSQNRQARWDAYQALPAEQKRQLAARAEPASAPAAGSVAAPGAAADIARKPGSVDALPDRGDKAARDAALAKSNIVPNPAFANRPGAVSPTVVRASPGATTTSISKRATPPSHQQTGLPKIAATPEFVDRHTLLPQRGPQGVPLHSEAASGPQRSPRQ